MNRTEKYIKCEFKAMVNGLYEDKGLVDDVVNVFLKDIHLVQTIPLNVLELATDLFEVFISGKEAQFNYLEEFNLPTNINIGYDLDFLYSNKLKIENIIQNKKENMTTITLTLDEQELYELLQTAVLSDRLFSEIKKSIESEE